MKLHSCKIKNTFWNSTPERSFIQITSPSGNSIFIRKIKLAKINPEEILLIEKISKINGNTKLTTDQMKLLVNIKNKILLKK